MVPLKKSVQIISEKIIALHVTNYKRYFIIDQKIARHFVQNSKGLYNPLPL